MGAERDRTCLLNVFPVEIWTMIVEKFDNSMDLEALSNSSLYFRELLLPQRTQFLFHNIWNFLGNTFELNYSFRGNIYSFIPPDNKNNNPQTVGGMNDWYPEILKLRLVCGAWNTAVENYHQHHQLHFNPEISYCWIDDNQRRYNHIRSRILKSFLVSTINFKILHFELTHSNTLKNPFLGRNVDVYIVRDNEYWFAKSVLKFLRKFGEHVWYCNLIIFNVPSIPQCYSRVWQVLRLLPNLKVLRVRYIWDGKNQSEMERQELQSEINLRPILTLKNLQMLTTDEMIASRNEQVSKLEVDRDVTHYHHCGIFSIPLPKLKTLVVSFQSEPSFLKMSDESVNWQLTELHLNLEACSTFINWQTVFNVLENNFKNTLTELKLKLPSAQEKMYTDQIYSEGHTFKLNLPLVTKLILGMKNLSCLDFLLPMISITELDLHVDLRHHNEHLENIVDALEEVEAGEIKTVKFLSCVQCPLETNVWNLFSKLNNVFFRVDTTKRHRYVQWNQSRHNWESGVMPSENVVFSIP